MPARSLARNRSTIRRICFSVRWKKAAVSAMVLNSRETMPNKCSILLYHIYTTFTSKREKAIKMRKTGEAESEKGGRWGEVEKEKGPVDLFPTEPTDEALVPRRSEPLGSRAPRHKSKRAKPSGLTLLISCGRWDLNPHGCNSHKILSLARLPIPTLPQRNYFLLSFVQFVVLNRTNNSISQLPAFVNTFFIFFILSLASARLKISLCG